MAQTTSYGPNYGVGWRWRAGQSGLTWGGSDEASLQVPAMDPTTPGRLLKSWPLLKAWPAASGKASAVPGILFQGQCPRGTQSGRKPLCLLEKRPFSAVVGFCLQLTGKASCSVLPSGAGLTFKDIAIS